MIEEFIPKLQKDLELREPLGMDGEGTYSFLLDDVKISLQSISPGFQLFSTLGELPNVQVELFLAKMLRGNLFHQATAHSVLGLDETGTKVMLRFSHPFNCSYKDFTYFLEDFMNTVDFWKSEIQSHMANPLAP